MAYDGLLLRAMIFELRRELIGRKVEKINQPQRGAFVLTFKNRHLLISVEPSASYVALTDSKMTNPAEPPMFCMLLRKYLSGATLTDIRQDGCDRTVYFVFSALNSSYEQTERTLVAEIMGRHANLLLLNEEKKIIDCIKRAALDSRQALPGLVYEAFSDNRKNILQVLAIGKSSSEVLSGETMTPFLEMQPTEIPSSGTLPSETPPYTEDTNFLKEFQGFSKMSARYASEHYDDLSALLSLRNSASNTAPDDKTDGIPKNRTDADDGVPNGYTCADANHRIPKGYTCADADGNILDFYFLREVLEEGYPNTSVTEYDSLSEATNAFYMRSLKAIRLKKISQDIKKIGSARLDRITGKISKMKSELEEAKNSGHFKLFGDLLLAHAYLIKEGTNQVTLPDFEGNEVEIPLDTKLSATQNAQKYYQKYKKSISAIKNLEIQMKEAEEDADFLSTSMVMLEFAEKEQDIEEVRRELEQAGFLKGIHHHGSSRHGQVNSKQTKSGQAKSKQSKSKQSKTKKQIHVHKFILSGGKTLLVGRSNTANDELTMKYASNSDTWLHTNTIPGSHCIIRCEGKEPTERDIEEAAEVAAYYSKAKMSSKVPVDYCKVKYVKKPPGARSGMVTYTNFKTVLVDPNIDHLKKEEAML